MRRSVGCFAAGPDDPIVSNQTLNRIQLGLVHFFPLVDVGPAHDELQNTIVFWRVSEVFQRRFLPTYLSTSTVTDLAFAHNHSSPSE